jgi:hypothetical protein
LTAALNELSDARDAVTVQEEGVADFLGSAFSNEFVKAAAAEAAGATNSVVGTLDASDVIEADIGEAHLAAAIELVGIPAGAANADVNDSITEGGAAFIALTDAAQDARIATAVTDLEADIAAAQTAVDNAAEDLQTAAVAAVATVAAESEDLVDALDAEDVAEASVANAVAAAEAVSTTDATSQVVTYTRAAGVITATADDGDANAPETLAITQVINGTISLVSGVVLNETTGNYTFTTTGDADVVVTIEQTFLDALVTRAQTELNDNAVVTSAENALAAAVNDAYNAQDPDFSGNSDVEYDFTFAELSATGAAAAGSGVIDVDTTTGAVAVAVDYDGDNAGAANVGTGDTPNVISLLNTYATNLGTLATEQDQLAAFNEALADWQATETLVDGLTALNSDLSDLNDAVTAAQDAIEDATDADPAGLGITLLEGTDNFTADSDVYLFAENTGLANTETLTGFGASGEDTIFFGEGFSLVQIADGSDISDSVGDSAALEILWQQTGTNGADLTLYVESAAFAGNGSSDVDVTTIVLTGFSATDITSFADGFLSAGEVA